MSKKRLIEVSPAFFVDSYEKYHADGCWDPGEGSVKMPLFVCYVDCHMRDGSFRRWVMS